MRCKPIRWLWGLIPILALAWFAAIAERERIEADLSKRVGEQLAAAGLSWAGAGIDGRNAVISGRAVDEADPAYAQAIVGKTWGVRTVESRAELIEKAETYTWSASLRDKALRLSGHYPNDAAHRAILSVAKATFPNREIEDRMKAARGAPARDPWLGAISFGLKQLAGLKSGSVELEALEMTVAGEAATPAAYAAIRSALAGSLPNGTKLRADRVTPAVVSPYTWTAAHNGRQLSLSGFAPSEEARTETAQAARTYFPRATLSDRTEIAAGAPAGWPAATTAILRQLALLEDGRAEASGAQITVKGVAADEGEAKAIRSALRSSLPRGFRLTEEITFKAPVLPVIRPFTTSIVADERTTVLTGYVPGEAAKTALIETTRARLPGRRIEDRLQIADGAPEAWQACLQAGLSSLGRLGAGTLAMSDRQLTLKGQTLDEALRERVPGELRSAANRSCDTDAEIALVAPPEPDLTWTAAYGDGAIVLEGEVSDQEAKTTLAEAAGRLFPSARLVDRTRVAGKPSQQWVRAAELGLQQLARLRSGRARLSGQELVLSGIAADATVAAAIRQQLGRETVSGYRGRETIEVRSEAIALAEQEARRKAEADARRAEAEAAAKRRAEDEAAAKRRAEAEAAAKRRAEEEVAAKRRAEAEACQRSVRDIASAGVILFERASADINAKSFATLDRIAKTASSCPGFQIEVEGHTDAEGTPERNKALSERRAAAIRDYLVNAGVAESRLTAVGYGAEQPVAPNDTPANRAKNRRIEFSVK